MNPLNYSDRSIYDEIYGYIPVTEIELEIIDNPIFQRLNHIRQLGSAYTVFPGAQHTRFSHSLGVMYIMDKMVTSKNLKEKVNDDDRQKLRLAALLHDIGHYPLSQVIETVMTDHNLKTECKHERFGEYIITNSSIKDIVSKQFNPKEVVQIFTGKSPEPLFNQLMSSDMDADRIDYLLRDSVHTGVAYGRFDLNRLLHTLDLDVNGLLCVENGGKHAAEGYVVGRYLMWATVYTHRVINAFNEVIEHIYELGMNGGKIFYSHDDLKRLLSENEIEFAKFNDHYFFQKAYGKKSENTHIDNLISMLLTRKVLKVAKDVQGLRVGGKGSKEYFLLDRYKKDNNLGDLSKRSGVPKEWIFHNNSNIELPGLKPLTEWPQKEETLEDIKKEMSKTLRIKREDGTSKPLVQDEKSVVHHLQNMSLDIVRIYTKKEYCEDLEKVLEKELSS